MIRQRRNLNLVGGADPAQFNSVRMFRVVSKVAPTASPVVLTPVIGDFPTDAITLPPGDSGWLPAGKGWSAIRLSCATSCSIDLWWLDSDEDLPRMPHDMGAGGASSSELMPGPDGWDAGLIERAGSKGVLLTGPGQGISLVGTGALSTPYFSTAGLTAIAIYSFNGDAAGTRNLTMNQAGDQAGTNAWSDVLANQGPGQVRFAVGQGVVTGSGVTAWALPLSPWMRVSLAAGAGLSCSLAVWGH